MMFFLLSALMIVHLLILTEVIPYDIVWAGRMNSVEEMRTFETIAISVNTFMLVVLFMKYRQLQRRIRNKVVDMLIWLFAGYFFLNTIGNLFAESKIELIAGTSSTLILSVLSVLIAKKDKQKLN